MDCYYTETVMHWHWHSTA